MQQEPKETVGRIAVIGDYLPRRCGIATFTTDLCEALAAQYPDMSCFAVPVNDTEDGYDYPPRVRFEMAERDLDSYRCAADFLNITNVDLVSLQHEFGIYGGSAGSHILALLRELRMPVVTTLHTVLREPDPQQRKVMKELGELSDRLVVMSERGRSFLQDVYAIPPEKIDLIPHGIPDVPFVDPNFYKDRFGVEGKLVLLTFGLLSPSKGIEYVLDALPEVLSRHPQIVYVLLGATHPHVVRHEGEAYRLMLQRMVRERGIEQNAIFHNRFVTLEELVEFIGAADLYLTPYLNREQAVSGTLAYTLGAGKAVISTPYWYAEEQLAEGRGVLVPFRDSRAIAAAVLNLLDDEAERHGMRKRAYLHGRAATWPNVARLYMESFQRAREERAHSPRPARTARVATKQPTDLPPLQFDHLRRLTDGTGMLQHAVFSVPRFSDGYCTDDNARALIAMVLLEELGGDELDGAKGLASLYLAFLWYAFNSETSRFRNFLSFQRQWPEDTGSEDSHGRALWALGTVLGRSEKRGLCGTASRLFELALPEILNIKSTRAWAYALLGIHEYLKRFTGDRAAKGAQEELAQRLLALCQSNSTTDWPWFEPGLTYGNATLPHAMLTAGQTMSRKDILEAGLTSLRWLIDIQRAEAGHFVPIGANGFFPRGGERARFDQQPIEAQATIAVCLEAQRLTGDEYWRKEAQRAFDWFLGRNDLHLPLYDPLTGGCRDGLHPDRVNQNQGAESTLSFLLSLLELRLSEEALNSSNGG
ncbi:MAG TPA: glycosyltransferase family 4 protein [Verrucomicrobiae bacterium]|nr:glycosyltransferase family 4 protein [Verrucomicrobiae bacterium]